MIAAIGTMIVVDMGSETMIAVIGTATMIVDIASETASSIGSGTAKLAVPH